MPSKKSKAKKQNKQIIIMLVILVTVIAGFVVYRMYRFKKCDTLLSNTENFDDDRLVEEGCIDLYN